MKRFVPWLQVRSLERDPLSSTSSVTLAQAAEALSMLLVNALLEDEKMSYLAVLPMCLVSLINLDLAFKEHSYICYKLKAANKTSFVIPDPPSNDTAAAYQAIDQAINRIVKQFVTVVPTLRIDSRYLDEILRRIDLMSKLA